MKIEQNDDPQGQNEIADIDKLRNALRELGSPTIDQVLVHTGLNKNEIRSLARTLIVDGEARFYKHDHMKLELVPCDMCGHFLANNSHGLDQNDVSMDENEIVTHSGSCTYCKECNPRLSKT